MAKIQFGPMTIEQAAVFLRQAAEATSIVARPEQRWDNFELICQEMLQATQAAASRSPHSRLVGEGA